MDAFAVSAAIAATIPIMTQRHTFRLAWHFGLFQGMMTIMGWLGGAAAADYFSAWNHWVAFFVLTLIGAKMIYESRDSGERVKGADPTRGWSLVMLSVATSLDALALGVSLSLLGVPVARPALLIGLVALIMSYAGAGLGRRAAGSLGAWAEVVGGIILIGIGVKILVEHASFG
jgi:putative Mn2+ efflux pump MntP